MDDKEQKRAAQKFVEFWNGKGYEKGSSRKSVERGLDF